MAMGGHGVPFEFFGNLLIKLCPLNPAPPPPAPLNWTLRPCKYEMHYSNNSTMYHNQIFFHLFFVAKRIDIFYFSYMIIYAYNKKGPDFYTSLD
jgi:hypothetical protein